MNNKLHFDSVKFCPTEHADATLAVMGKESPDTRYLRIGNEISSESAAHLVDETQFASFRLLVSPTTGETSGEASSARLRRVKESDVANLQPDRKFHFLSEGESK